MSTVTAALLGLDNPHSSSWFSAFKHSPHVQRTVVFGPEGDCAGADAVYRDLDALLKQESPDFGLVCTRNDRAPALAAALIRAGIPTIVEKPVARTPGEVRRLTLLARKHGVVLTAGYSNRFQPLAQEFRRLVREGALGRVVSIEANMVTSTVRQRHPDHWLFDHAAAGGGILSWLACHTFDLIRFITGLEFRRVSGQVATLSGENITVEDVAAVSFEMSNGALGTLHAGYVLRSRYGDIKLNMRGTLGEASWPMYGLNGRMDTLYVRSDAPGWETTARKDITAPYREEPPGYGESLSQALIANVLAAAKGKRKLLISGDDAFRALQVIDAAYQSSRTGRAVALRG
ncbi:MAG: Gfo/Idh/MocA family oxidoreductase [Planctomycetes bacterium]|nr:Gfo/Idh/MocA family oxidoreductase [Planctomycetota bacterium]